MQDEAIPLRGASDEQLAIVRERLAQLFPAPTVVLAHGERRRAARALAEPIAPPENTPPPPPVQFVDRRTEPLGDLEFLARIAYLGEIVWYWTVNRKPRAAIVTYVHSEGDCDLAVFERDGFAFRARLPRGRCNGWTPRGSLE